MAGAKHLAVHQQADTQEDDGQDDVADQRADADVPAHTIEQDIAEFQRHQGDAQHEGGPIEQRHLLTYGAAVSGDGVHQKGKKSSDEVGDHQAEEGIGLHWHGFGTEIVKNISNDDDSHRQIIIRGHEKAPP